jgi:hypothetical protein
MESDLEDLVELNPSPPTASNHIDSIWDDDNIEKVRLVFTFLPVTYNSLSYQIITHSSLHRRNSFLIVKV